MLKKLLFSVVLVCWVSSSHSESITPYYGATPNAAGNGLQWSMDNYLPSNTPGVSINGVIYNYTINKDVNDTVGVEIRNLRANGSGYIFRERDEWLPGSLGGTQINKAVPVVPSNRSLWGNGEIAVDGPGSVSNPKVIYTYKVDPCYDPQFDANCPGYVKPVPVTYEVDLTTLYDPLTDENVTLEQTTCREGDKSPECKGKTEEDSDEKREKSEDELKAEEEREKEKKKERLEKALAAADNSALFANALANSTMLDTMNLVVNMNTYYNKALTGGTYPDAVALKDTKLPENRRGLRNGLAQQLLHEKMVEMQY